MILQGLNPMNRTISGLIDFCKLIKLTKDLPTLKNPDQEKSTKDSNKGGKKASKKRNMPEGKNLSLRTYHSMLHGPNNTHNTQDCYTPKNLVKQTKGGKRNLDQSPKSPKK